MKKYIRIEKVTRDIPQAYADPDAEVWSVETA
jgi:hypothetical protein